MPHHRTQHNSTVAWTPQQRQEAFWGLLDRDVRQLVTQFAEQAMQLLLEEAVGAKGYQRSPQRRAWRNGYYRRQLATGYGPLTLRVPRRRDGGLDCRLIFEPYQRRVADVERALCHAYLLGVSTRGTAELAEQLFGGSLSHQTVSRLLRWLDQRLREYRQQPIAPVYPLVQLDGMHLSVGGHDRVAVLVVGLREDGRQEVLGFSLAPGEQCRELLWDLRRRGLEGVKLFSADGSGAIESALAEVYGEVPRQECITHRLRRLWERLGERPERRTMVRQAARIFRCFSASTAAQVALAWQRKWWTVAPEEVAWFMDGLGDSLLFYDLPERWWRKARTTNPVERLIRTLRMRLRPIGAFYDDPAAERAIFGQLLRWHLIPETTQTT
jgi:putative transposase